MTAGALTVYLAYLSKFFKPVKDLAGMASSIAQTTVALERIQKILIADDIIRDPLTPSIPAAQGRISFEHVAFGYGDEPPVLRDVCFHDQARPGGGNVGPTGSSKSTVVSLMPRFYQPTGGRV